MLARIDHLACFIDEMFFTETFWVIWRPEINGNQIVNIRGPAITIGALRDYHLCNVDPQEPTRWQPIWLQSNQTISIRLALLPGFDMNVFTINRIAGHIYKPTNPLIGV
jgi:hypothetical protein